MKDNDGGFILTCGQVSLLSPVAEIEAYLEELQGLPKRPEVIIEIQYVEQLLVQALE
jgi:hypothetical protein